MIKEFTFEVTYFKKNGKFYTTAEYVTEIKTCNDDTEIPYMYDIVSKIKELRDSGEQNVLPGLVGTKWEGPILITCEKGYPCLII